MFSFKDTVSSNQNSQNLQVKSVLEKLQSFSLQNAYSKPIEIYCVHDCSTRKRNFLPRMATTINSKFFIRPTEFEKKICTLDPYINKSFFRMVIKLLLKCQNYSKIIPIAHCTMMHFLKLLWCNMDWQKEPIFLSFFFIAYSPL